MSLSFRLVRPGMRSRHSMTINMLHASTVFHSSRRIFLKRVANERNACIAPFLASTRESRARDRTSVGTRAVRTDIDHLLSAVVR